MLYTASWKCGTVRTFLVGWRRGFKQMWHYSLETPGDFGSCVWEYSMSCCLSLHWAPKRCGVWGRSLWTTTKGDKMHRWEGKAVISYSAITEPETQAEHFREWGCELAPSQIPQWCQEGKHEVRDTHFYWWPSLLQVPRFCKKLSFLLVTAWAMTSI
jgi:hypothetical protein